MVIAVDFDGTIVEHRYPRIGKPIPFAIETLQKLHADRHLLILWTVREGELLQEAIDYCASKGLHFYAHNANFPEENRLDAPRKLTADIFIDDRNLGGLVDWEVMYQVITALRKGSTIVPMYNLEEGGNVQRRKQKKGFLASLFKS